MGYAGGHQANPDYHNIGDHTETVQVDYDPRRITYSQLLDIFWKSHKPTRGGGPRQYMRAVFYHDEDQHQLAVASMSAVEQKLGQPIKTRLAPLHTFTMAEDYHQKYMLKQHHRLKSEMQRFYPDHGDLVGSTAVARVNGYAGGHGTRKQFSQDVGRLGLSEAGRQELAEIMERRWNFDRQ